MTLPTRRSIITGLGAGAGLATAGLLSPSPAAAAESSHEFSSVIFDEQFSSGMDFSPSRWRDNRSEPESCTSYDWGVFTHDAHSVSNGVGHVLWRKRATPLKGFQNRFDKEPTLRYVDQAFVTTQGLFSFVYGSLETRARFPQSAEGLFAGQPYHEVSRSASQKEFDACFGDDAAYHICLTTHSGSIHRGRLKHEGFTQAQVDIDYIVVRAMDE